jgi:hypothetical protein
MGSPLETSAVRLEFAARLFPVILGRGLHLYLPNQPLRYDR